MDIDAVIAEATQETQEAETVEAVEVEETTEQVEEAAPVEQEDEEAPETEEVEETEAKVQEDVPFPKKAVNAISKRDKTINKLKARLEELETAQKAFEANRKDPQSQPTEQIDADKFETYDDYIKALVEQQTKTLTHKQAEELQEATLTQQREAAQNEYIAAREEEIAEQARATMAEVPDMAQLLQSQGQVFDTMPQEVAQVFYEIDNAPAAAYVLAKEGKLANLGRLPLAVAAAEIVRAQDKFEQYKKPKQQLTNAPKPMTAAKAKGGSSTKKLADMSVEELMKWKAAR